MAEDDVTTTEEGGSGLSRRELLRRAGVGAAAAGIAGSGAGKAFAFAGPHKFTHRQLSGSLSILQWVHFVPDYDVWFDKYAKSWGEKNDVDVTIDHINNTQLVPRATAEVAATMSEKVFGTTGLRFSGSCSGSG